MDKTAIHKTSPYSSIGAAIKTGFLPRGHFIHIYIYSNPQSWKWLKNIRLGEVASLDENFSEGSLPLGEIKKLSPPQSVWKSSECAENNSFWSRIGFMPPQSVWKSSECASLIVVITRGMIGRLNLFGNPVSAPGGRDDGTAGLISASICLEIQ